MRVVRRGWVGALLVLAACGGDGEAAQTKGGAGGPGGGRGGPPAVETAAVERGTIARDLSVSGNVESLRTVGVNSQVGGAVLSVNVQEGDAVARGAVLASMDGRELAAQVRSAQASYEVARSAHERARKLRESQVVTEAEYERDRAAAEAARATLEGLRTRLGYTVIRAPSAGVVTEKKVEAGDVIGAQTPLFTLADLSTPVVRVGISERDVVSLSSGQSAQVTLDALPGRTFPGRIRRIFPTADPQTRLVPVEVALQGEGARMARPGFLARITFALGAQEGVLLLPQSAIVGDGGVESVFVLNDSTVERRSVETGLTSQGRVQIASGLQEGEIVVVTGNNRLREGAAVRVTAGPGASARPAREGAPAGGRQRGGGGS